MKKKRNYFNFMLMQNTKGPETLKSDITVILIFVGIINIKNIWDYYNIKYNNNDIKVENKVKVLEKLKVSNKVKIENEQYTVFNQLFNDYVEFLSLFIEVPDKLLYRIFLYISSFFIILLILIVIVKLLYNLVKKVFFNLK